MKTFIIKVNPLKMPNFGNYSTFQEEFEKYARKCKKKQWATPEGFSLEFDTTLQDLKESVFVKRPALRLERRAESLASPRDEA